MGYSRKNPNRAQLLWPEMTLFSKKASYIIEKHNSAKTYFNKKKFLKAYDLVLLPLQKKLFFAFNVAHGDSIFAKVGPKNGNCQGF